MLKRCRITVTAIIARCVVNRDARSLIERTGAGDRPFFMAAREPSSRWRQPRLPRAPVCAASGFVRLIDYFRNRRHFGGDCFFMLLFRFLLFLFQLSLALFVLIVRLQFRVPFGGGMADNTALGRLRRHRVDLRWPGWRIFSLMLAAVPRKNRPCSTDIRFVERHLPRYSRKTHEKDRSI